MNATVEEMALTLQSDGWFRDTMIIKAGPPDKQYTERWPKHFMVSHSVVGTRAGAESRIFSLERETDNPLRYSNYAAMSVPFVINKIGPPTQYYTIDASCWTSSTRPANIYGLATELEGGYFPHNELMTDNQVYWWMVIVLAAANRYEWSREIMAKQLENLTQFPFGYFREHRQFASTACPSGRYQRGYEALLQHLQGGNKMSPEERAEFNDLKKKVKEMEERRQREESAHAMRRDIRELADGPYANMKAAYDVLKYRGFLRVGDA